MRLQKLLFGVGFFSVLSLLGWIGVLFLVDPESYGTPGMVLFLGTAFSFLSGTFALILVTLARRFLGDAGAEESFGTFFRQGFLLASFVIGLLLLSRFGILAWWTGALAFVAVLLVELSARSISDGNGGAGNTE
jgi:hypothetical protein